MVIDTDLEEILAKALEETRGPGGQVNLAEIQRRTGVSRKRLRRWKNNGFHLQPDKRGRKPGSVKLKGYTEIIDGLLAQGIRNRDVVHRELQKAGFDGGKTIAGEYIASHLDLLPAPRAIVAPQGEYTRRWYTESGDCYQMDWGFSRWKTRKGAGGSAHALSWSATTAATATSSSSPTQDRRTCSSACYVSV